MLNITKRFFVASVLMLVMAIPAAALDRSVRIVNKTGYTMVQFFGSYRDTDSWQEDILGSQVLPSGSYIDIDFNDGTGYCIFDFKAVFDDGDEVTAFNKNVCELGTFTFN